MTTFKEVRAEDVDDVFLDTDEFAETVKFYPDGDPDREVTITCLVDSGHEEGSRETEGDGIVPDQESGNAVRHSIVVSMKTSVDLQDPQGLTPDTLQWKGAMYYAVRVIGRDDDMMDVLCASFHEVYSTYPTMK